MLCFRFTKHPLYAAVRNQPHKRNQYVETPGNPLLKESCGNSYGIQER